VYLSKTVPPPPFAASRDAPQHQNDEANGENHHQNNPNNRPPNTIDLIKIDWRRDASYHMYHGKPICGATVQQLVPQHLWKTELHSKLTRLGPL
jgi:hypothetical protein